MGYFKELYDRPVQRPNNDIAIIDRNQISQQSEKFILVRAIRFFSHYNLKIIRTDGTKCYKGKCTSNTHAICTLEKSTIFSLKESSTSKESRKKIYLGKDYTKPIGKVKYRHSNRKYKIEFTNLITGDTDYLEMNSDKRLVVCGIFYGKEKEGGQLIAKIIRDSKDKTKCFLEIAPGVDNIFMMGLAAFFSDRVPYKSRISNEKKRLSMDSMNFSDEDDGDGDGDEAGDYNDYGYDSYGDCDAADFGGDGGYGGDGGDGGGGDGGGGD